MSNSYKIAIVFLIILGIFQFSIIINHYTNFSEFEKLVVLFMISLNLFININRK
jgi:hypothetical protein